jgi:hypothetical protein
MVKGPRQTVTPGRHGGDDFGFAHHALKRGLRIDLPSIDLKKVRGFYIAIDPQEPARGGPGQRGQLDLIGFRKVFGPDAQVERL